MPVLKQQIATQAKGSLSEREDWWRLCYDTDQKAFFIEHEWSHMNAYNIGKAADAGTERTQIEGYSGPGADKIEDVKANLLAKAGHA